MENKELYENLIQIIREAGIPVVTDPQQIRDALDGQLMRDNLLDATIQKMIYSYEEENDPPDLSPRMIDIEDKNGRPQKMYSVAFCGKRPKDYTPTKVGKAYKLMEQWPDGTLHALFAGTNKTYDLGKWNWAQGFTRDEQIGDMAKGLAPRYGWHMGTGVPATHHLMGVGDTLNPKMGYYSKTESGHPKGSKRVWVEVFYDASKDYTDVAEKNPSKSEKDIRGLVPFGGYYMFQESNLSNWVIASSIKFNRVISERERQSILKEAGYDEENVWREKVLSAKLKSARTSCLNILAGKKKQPTPEQIQKTKKKLERIEELIAENEQLYTPSKTTKHRKLTTAEIQAERDRIRAGIIDNPELAPATIQHFQTDEGNVYGFVKNDVIYLDTQKIDPIVPIHEYTHIWDRICQQENPELWQQGVDLMKKTALWKAIEQSPAYQDIRSDDNLMASEVHARLAAQQGTKILKKAIGNTSLAKKLKTWAKSYWNTVANCFNPKGKKEIKLQTAEDFAALPVKDLLSGKDLRQYLQTKNVR